MSRPTRDQSQQALPNLFVSARLPGNPVRYDGKAKSLDHDELQLLLKQGRVIAFCPEVAGAELALALCRQHDISTALLTELSPSCGSGPIYDGSFTRQSFTASGVTTALLQQHGIKVFNQYRVDEALDYLTT